MHLVRVLIRFPRKEFSKQLKYFAGEIVEAVFWNKHFKCTDEADPRSEIFIVERTIANMPIRISNLGFQHFKYRKFINNKCTK